MGNVTVTLKRRNVVGGRVRQSFDLTFSASYATNGDTIQAADIAKLMPGVNDLTKVETAIFELGSAGHEAFLDRAAAKVKAFNGTTEIANATNLTTVVVRGVIEYGDGVSAGV